MKKMMIHAFWMTWLLTFCLVPAAFAEDTLQIYHDGAFLGDEALAFIEEGTTYIQIRPLIESLGGTVEWSAQDEPFGIALGGIRLEMRIGSDRALRDGKPVVAERTALLRGERTYLPLRFVTEQLGFAVRWNGAQRRVDLVSRSDSAERTLHFDATKLGVMGEPYLTLEEMQNWFAAHVEGYQELPALYYEIGARYGIRPDLALAQAMKETGFFRYGGLVLPEQNNLCGLYATGRMLDGTESLYGADPDRVWLEAGRHGATFDSLRSGVEAHLQHLYAYATNEPLPDGTSLVDPRFKLLDEALSHLRGSAPVYAYLGAADNPNGIGWAYPGEGYGFEIVALFEDVCEQIRDETRQ